MLSVTMAAILLTVALLELWLRFIVTKSRLDAHGPFLAATKNAGLSLAGRERSRLSL